MMPYPLLFRPILKERIWGGRALEKLGKPLPEGRPIGESWEVADLPPEVAPDGGQSVIANGPLAGRTLREAIASHGELILGHALGRSQSSEASDVRAHDTRFPLLIKYLDARENLSVQVHPDRKYAAKHPDSHVKDEAWVVVDHDPGAVIYSDFKTELDEAELREHIASGKIELDLNAIEVKRFQCHYLPSGTVHALGAGVVVVEVQTPSDTTFRIYDWGRTSRTLHVDEALEVIVGGSSPNSQRRSCRGPQSPVSVANIRTTSLLEAEHFNVERVEALDDGPFEIITSNLPEVWMILDAPTGGRIDGNVAIDLETGTTTLLPAGMPESQAYLATGTQLLRITLPSPLKGMIA